MSLTRVMIPSPCWMTAGSRSVLGPGVLGSDVLGSDVLGSAVLGSVRGPAWWTWWAGLAVKTLVPWEPCWLSAQPRRTHRRPAEQRAVGRSAWGRPERRR